MSKSRLHLPHIILWTILCLLFFGSILMGRQRLPEGDFSAQFHTFASFQAEEMQAGRLPLWSMGSYAGFPFAADVQTAVFYPLRWLTILLSTPWGFPDFSLMLEAVLHLWLTGLFTYFLAYDITRQRGGALIAAITFGLGGYLTGFPLQQLAILEAITWLPLVLLLLRCGVRAKRPLPWLLGAGAVLGLSFLAGHPQTFLHMSYLAALYYLFLTVQAHWRWRWLLGFGLLVLITAVGISAAAWLPAAHYLRYSTRSDVSYEFVASGYALLDYLQIWLPGPYAHWVAMYVSIPAISLLILGWLLRRTVGFAAEKKELLFWTAVILITILLSLGDKGILFEFFYRFVPGFSLFRQQERLVSFASLGMALSAAIGFSFWLQAETSVRRHAVRQLAFILAGILLAVGLVTAVVGKQEWFSLWVRQGMITAVTLLLLASHQKIKWQTGGLVLLLFLDLFLVSRPQLNLQPATQDLWTKPDWIEPVKSAGTGRIETQGFYTANAGELLGVEDIRGISPLKPKSLSRFEELPASLRWQLLNVTYVLAGEAFVDGMVSPAPVEAGITTSTPFQTNLYQFSLALPRAWLVYDPIIAAHDDEAFQILQQPEFEPTAQVVLTKPVRDVTAVTPPSIAPTITTTQTTATEHRIQVSTKTPGILVISEWHYPGWQAHVNDESWPLETADYALQALILPAGIHDIQLRYTPWDVPVGVGISLLTLLIAVLIAWRWRPAISIHKQRPFSAYHWLSGHRYHLITASNKRSFSVSRYAPFMMALLLLWGFALRLSTTATQDLRGDEAFTVLFARNSILDIITRLVEVGETLGPFQYIVIYLWQQLVGSTELALRYMSVLLGVLVLALMAQIGKRLSGISLGLLLLGLLSVSQSMIWISQDVRSYAWMQVLILIATLLLLYATSGRRPYPGWLLWGAYALICALAVYNHYYSVFALAAHGLYVWFEPGKRQFFKSWALSGLAATALFVIYPLLMWSRWLALGHIGQPDKPELGAHLTAIGQELIVGPAFDASWGRWLFLAGLATAVWGAIRLYKMGKRGWSLFLSGWLGLTALGIFLIRFYRSLFNIYYISPAAPAWWLLVGVGLLLLWRRGRWERLLSGLLVTVIIAANLLSLRNYYFVPNHNRNNGFQEIATYLADQVQLGDVFIAHSPDPTLEYYLQDILPIAFQPVDFNVPANETEDALHDLAQTYDRIWFIPYSDFDSDNIVGRWLDYHMLHESQSQHQNLPLWAYRPLRTVDEAATPVNALLNEEISLQSAYVTVNGQPANLSDPVPVSSGDLLSLSLIWSAADAVSENYTVFVHLLADDGSLIAQHDGVPLFGTRPTTTWNPGEQLLDRHELVIMETGFEGNGRLLVGMYHSDTLERLPFANGETVLELAPGMINP